MGDGQWSLREAVRTFARGWEAFFHAPCDARICAVIRMVYAGLVLIHLAVLYPDLDLWFTESGVLPLENALKLASPYSWTLLAYLPGTSAVVHTCFWIMVGHAVCLLVGLLPRLNALLLFIWLISFQVRNDPILDGEDCLMRVMGFFVIWLPSGRCWSVNALVRRWVQGSGFRVQERKRGQGTGDRGQEEGREVGGRRSEVGVPGWALRLLQIEMAAMLFSSALMKLAGWPWVNGTALYYVARLDDFFGRFPVPAWAFDTPWVVAVMTWSVVAAEFCIPILLWFRETRRPCLLILLVFHLANEWTMNLFLFHWIMLCGWMSFVRVEDFSWRGKSTADGADDTD